MSRTEIKSKIDPSIRVGLQADGRHDLLVWRLIPGETDLNITLDRAAFIRAIETELDGTFISHADLPKVEPVSPHAVRIGEQHFRTEYHDHLADALNRIAVARHLEANPPIDEAAVDALAKVLSNEGDGGIWEFLDARNSRIVARRLVEVGVRVPEASSQPDTEEHQ